MKREWHSAESVAEGQSDKLCDQIADAVLDAVIVKDRFARVECNTFAAPGIVFVSGQITTKAYIDLTSIVRETVREIGYTDSETGFDYANIAVLSIIEEQAPDLALAVDKRGAGNQGIVVGFATSGAHRIGLDTEFMPMSIWLAHRLTRALGDFRKGPGKDILLPDGQSQVTIAYNDLEPARLVNLSLSAQHRPEVNVEALRERLMEEVVEPQLADAHIADDKTVIHVNPAGPFTLGGPKVDTGISGRKQVVDAYGPVCRHGGVSLSGKDPTKTDRSASYMARYLAKNIVAAGLADCCEVRLAYIIGMEAPTSLQIETFGTGEIPDGEFARALWNEIDLTTPGIINHLNLLRPLYRATACYGHYGKPELPWESLDLEDKLGEIAGRFGG